MENYKVFWKDIWIGDLFIKSDGSHKYQANEKAVKSLNEVAPLDPILMVSRDWGDAIPFFKSRLESAAKFPDLGIGFQTDSYRLEKASENV